MRKRVTQEEIGKIKDLAKQGYNLSRMAVILNRDRGTIRKIVNDNNIKEIVILGRKRWKIENVGFYNQKHRIFDITHLNSRNDNAVKCHYFFIQIAHTIRQLLEKGNILTKSLKLKIKEVSAFLLKTLTTTISDLNNIKTNTQLRFDD